MSRKWLVPHDLSAHADAALAHAYAELTLRGGGTLIVMHALPDVYIPTSFAWPVAGVPNEAALYRQWEEDALKDLQAHIANTPAPEGVELDVRVQRGAPAPVILDTAGADGVERIVMGTHGRTGFSRLALGSIAERVVRGADVPVTTVKGPE